METYYVIWRKPDVILLNGSLSTGKSSIAQAMRQKLCDSGSAVVISLDNYLHISANEPIWEDDVFSIMPRMCEDIQAALQDGKTVIIDYVITSARIYHALNDAVVGYQMKTVLVSCDVETLRRRETERGDRCACSAEASLQYLYPKTGYDLCVDSCKATQVLVRNPSRRRKRKRGADIDGKHNNVFQNSCRYRSAFLSGVLSCLLYTLHSCRVV